MTTNQLAELKKPEEEKKTTNWYLVGGVTFAAGLAILATVTVLTTKKKRKLQAFHLEEDGDELDWSEDSQFFGNFLTATKSTFSKMWGSAMNGLKSLDSTIRSHLAKDEPMTPFVSECDAKENVKSMTEEGDDFITDGF